jgi:cytochrome c biogenesis factor
MLIGVIASSAYSGDKRLALQAGESAEAYGEEVVFTGSTAGAGLEERHLNLLLVQGDDTTCVSAKSQVSNYTGQVMLTPYIDKGFLYDVYIAPLEFRPAEAQHHALTLVKGEAYEHDGWNLTFTKFDMSQHGGAQMMSVGAVIEAERDGRVEQIIPSMESGPEGRRASPVVLPGTEISISLVGMSVEQKSVTLEVDDPVAAGTSESLAISISRKPLASLVWIGCLLISAGTALSYKKRRLEERLIAMASPTHSASSAMHSGRRSKATVLHY